MNYSSVYWDSSDSNAVVFHKDNVTSSCDETSKHQKNIDKEGDLRVYKESPLRYSPSKLHENFLGSC